MIRQDLFVTTLYMKMCKIDLVELEKKCLEYYKDNESVYKSNIGGYQGNNFCDETLFHEIAQSIPTVNDKFLGNISIESWVNINGKGSYNERHHHDPIAGTFMSGVFYVKVPQNSGKIIFYDPRPSIMLKTKDMMYYNNGYTYHYYDPSENLMLLFPPWLEHSVEKNESEENRISIAFNILLN